jgi:NDP-sugar pyrophosphorylase family protein
MRAMIVAAGLGTRLRPLTELRPKPALPVRGLPLIAFPLSLLSTAGVSEVVVNVHHLPDVLIRAAERYCPPDITLSFSHEPELLHTGGAIRRVADFLAQSDPCLVLGGDMIVDLDLGGLVKRHQAADRAVTLVLKEDARGDRFGTIGVDERGRVRRIASRFDLGGESRAGVYTWINVFSAAALETLPDRLAFNHLDDWLAPRLNEGAEDIGAEVLASEEGVWEPVGTLEEYLAVNLQPRALSFFDADARAKSEGARLMPDLVVGAGATLGRGARLHRAVVWDGEQVPAGFRGENGVFAGGAFHASGSADPGLSA